MSDLYFILNPALGIVKIGVSANVPDRVASLEHSCGVPLELLRMVKGGANREITLHEIFHASRLKGEWFDPTEELLALALGTEGITEFIARKRDVLDALIASRRLAGESRQAAREERERERRAELAAKREVERKKEQKRKERERAREEAKEKQRAEELAAWSARSVDALSTRLQSPDANTTATQRRAFVEQQRARNAAFNGVRTASANG